MGAALGMLFGAGVRALGDYTRKKAEQEQQHDQLLMSLYQSRPDLAGTPQAQEYLKKKHGKDVANAFMQLGSAFSDFSKQAGGMPAFPGSAGGAPAMAAPAGGGATPPQAAQPPAVQQIMQATGGRPAGPAPTGGPAVAPMTARPAPAAAGPTPINAAGYGAPDDPETYRRYGADIRKWVDDLSAKFPNDPRLADIRKNADDHIKQAEDYAKGLETKQERAAGLEEKKTEAQRRDEDRRADVAWRQEERARQDAFNNWYKTETLKDKETAKADKESGKTEQQFQTHASQLGSRKIALMNNLQAKLQAGTYDAKTAKPMVDAFNKNVDQMKTTADKLGLEFNPDDYHLSIQEGTPGYFGTRLGAGKPTIEEASPETGDIDSFVKKYGGK